MVSLQFNIIYVEYGLESHQALRRIESNAVLSFDWNWSEQNDPTACWHQLHPRFQVLQQGKCLRYPPEHVGVVIKTTICVGGIMFIFFISKQKGHNNHMYVYKI